MPPVIENVPVSANIGSGTARVQFSGLKFLDFFILNQKYLNYTDW